MLCRWRGVVEICKYVLLRFLEIWLQQPGDWSCSKHFTPPTDVKNYNTLAKILLMCSNTPINIYVYGNQNNDYFVLMNKFWNKSDQNELT